MANLGFRTDDEMVGKSEKLDTKDALNYYKIKGIDLSKILYKPNVDENTPLEILKNKIII